MKRIISFVRMVSVMCMLMCASANVFAQEAAAPETDTPAVEQNTIHFQYKPYTKGDQYLRVSIALTSPLGFGDLFSGNAKLRMGGAGTLGYHYMLLDWLAIGGDVSFGFNTTIGSHIYNYIPILFTVTAIPTAGKFEFPVNLGIGFATETYNNYKYFPGLVIKPEAGAYYRFNTSWSAGVDVAYLFMPQFAALYSTSGHNIMGQFLHFSIAARYHF